MSDLRELPALAPGKTHTIETIIELAPGIHRLQLQLDKLQQVEESNEQNNAAAVTLKLTGTCNGSLRNTLPSKPAMSPNGPTGALPVKTLPLKPANSQLEPRGAIQAR
jgi:subtilase family serine protease